MYSITFSNNDLKLLPIYLFMAFLMGFLAWELIKFIIFIIRTTGKDKKANKNLKNDKGFYDDSKKTYT